jgi:hypothetical protein
LKLLDLRFGFQGFTSSEGSRFRIRGSEFRVGAHGLRLQGIQFWVDRV